MLWNEADTDEEELLSDEDELEVLLLDDEEEVLDEDDEALDEDKDSLEEEDENDEDEDDCDDDDELDSSDSDAIAYRQVQYDDDFESQSIASTATALFISETVHGSDVAGLFAHVSENHE